MEHPTFDFGRFPDRNFLPRLARSFRLPSSSSAESSEPLESERPSSWSLVSTRELKPGSARIFWTVKDGQKEDDALRGGSPSCPLRRAFCCCKEDNPGCNSWSYDVWSHSAFSALAASKAERSDSAGSEGTGNDVGKTEKLATKGLQSCCTGDVLTDAVLRGCLPKSVPLDLGLKNSFPSNFYNKYYYLSLLLKCTWNDPKVYFAPVLRIWLSVYRKWLKLGYFGRRSTGFFNYRLKRLRTITTFKFTPIW